MIGWSRRGTESRARRARWWSSLSEEERSLEERRHEEERRLSWTLFLVPLPSMAVFLVANLFAPRCVPLLVAGVALFPLSLVADVFWTMWKVSKIR